MGAVSFSIDTRLVECFKDVLPLPLFIESGSFQGDTIASVEKYFDRLVTIERSEALWNSVSARFENVKTVKTFLGGSAEVLAELHSEFVDTSTLFWLDAHWCVASNTVGKRSQCPLLNELHAIGELGKSSVVLIDDARLFMAPPPAPHEISQWPSFEQVLGALRDLSDGHEIMIINDVIAFFPKRIRAALIGFAQKHGVDWLAVFPYLDPDNDLIKALEEKEEIIQSQRASLLQQSKELEEKREMSALFFMFESGLRPFGWIVRPIYRTLRPRLGNLSQYQPRRIKLPKGYHTNSPVSGELPKISIVTPSYNQVNFVERTIKSVLSQSYINLEYFVQDGASEDGTRAVLERYSDKLTGWESHPDQGQSQAINQGFSKTSGEIMAWLNSDDILLPGALFHVADYFKCHPEVDVVYGHRILIDENDQQIGDWMLPAHDDKVLSWADFIPQETMFWRRSIWKKAGGLVDESFQFAMDWDLLIRFRDAGACFSRLPRFLGGFRVHPEQKTLAAISEVGIREMNQIRQRTLGRIPMKSEIQKAILSYLLRHVFIDFGWRVKQRIMRK